MVTEYLVLVALFDIPLFLRLFPERDGLFLLRPVSVCEPRGKFDRFLRTERCLNAAEHGHGDRAVSRLSALDLDKVDRRVANKISDKQVCRMMVYIQRGLILLQNAVVDEADLGCKRHGLHLVMRDVNKGGTCFNVQPLQFIAHFQTQLCVEV